ncbi:tol-pal system-associated acyl-CoA thioesterase [Paracoccus sp. PS-1]|uniref:tol-pal system-associated acyl-CoA thioesterase n=1 Tax=unclassified Paracoccus (in: a-proteobacteria) TaxID=2688777 RepID=UPI000490FA63|nr:MULTISPECIES: tol-pal system-associated acyl-CoA thioesterase [unclassified Paracoccus (in: a-proteobacteria)]MDQ7263217.1 tol-pal system-associated acyl-CoA thioesterase [Paracoccus sp. PS1]RQP07842.1 MAG: tol-pal system-associated acyl-CoA thioesterase [Paracoccus sp. BP8]
MHKFPIRIYYEDTDLAGIVYYANYLKFIERARSEWLRELGVDQGGLQRRGLVFAVRRVEADYLSPARFEDLLAVESRLEALSPARIVLDQAVTRDGRLLFRARVTLACLADSGRPARIPAAVAERLRAADLAGN